ncbi:hypothetical protein KCU99_g2694, partial [Aureobasidium melanogenum]
MAQPPTVIDLSKDDQATRQASNATLHKLIAIDQDFAENLALQALGEIEKLWPDLKAERFTSQDIVDLSTTLRTGKINLEFRMLRAFLVLWKDNLKYRQDMSSQQLIDLAVSLHSLVPRQLGPAEKQSSAANGPNASQIDGSQVQSHTTDHYLQQYHAVWPDVLFAIFHREELDDTEYVEGPGECRSLWPDLEDELIPTVKQLKMMARDMRAARSGFEFGLLRAFVVGWMSDPPERLIVADGKRTNKIRKMALAQMGPENMVTHNDGTVTVLRKIGESDNDPKQAGPKQAEGEEEVAKLEHMKSAHIEEIEQEMVLNIDVAGMSGLVNRGFSTGP